MICDLAGCDDDQKAAAEVCVIGGGIAGLIIADRLRRHRRTVVVLESGGRTDDGRIDPLNQVRFEDLPYRGATVGRARALGGTSTRWGGALIPFLPEDLAARPFLGLDAWPVEFADVAPYIAEVESHFAVDGSSYNADFLNGRRGMPFPNSDSDILLRFAKWPSFKKRNVATLLAPRLDSDPGALIWLNATVTQLDVDRQAGRLREVVARSRCGRRLTARARHFVICGGAIESTRLLLLLHRQSDLRVFEGCEALGLGFHDHLSLPAANIATNRASDLNRLAGFRFHAGGMRSPRFELAPRAQEEERTASSFGHIAFETVHPTGFDAMRDALRAWQSKGRPNAWSILKASKDLPYLVRAACWRVFARQLLWPAPARYRLHVVLEMLPKTHNRIRLSDDLDELGAPRTSLAWRVDENDLNAASAFARRFGSYWHRTNLQRLGTLDWDTDALSGYNAVGVGTGDIFHPGGTTRMGRNGREAVVDHNLAAFAVPNLSVASTSTFPSGASANPTLMLMAFALRLADRLGAGRLS